MNLNALCYRNWLVLFLFCTPFVMKPEHLDFLPVLICILSFLHRSEFVFINPNSKGQCGCGESFMTTTGSSGGASKQGGS